MSITVSGLFCHPFKSAKRIPLKIAEVGFMGIVYDRQWGAVDENGMFVAQRSDHGKGVGIRSLCLIQPSFEDSNLRLKAPDMDDLVLPLAGRSGDIVNTTIWESQIDTVNQGKEAADWISEYLSRERRGKYRIVRVPDDAMRKTKRDTGFVGLADGYQFLLVSQESLDDLNARMDVPLPDDRFRPNIVVTGCMPYEEDTFGYIKIGNVAMEGIKRCVRCPITTFDQSQIVRGREPLAALAKYRRTEKGVVMAMNFSHYNNGTLYIGSPVTVFTKRENMEILL